MDSFFLLIIIIIFIIYLGDTMYTIEDTITNELSIKNSKFITILYKIKNVNDVNIVIDKYKEIYPNADHYCYAYIIDSIKKSSDDGEPSSTAGIPILKVLENNNLTNILCLVIRYFGGIKLGANGLIRAYTKATANAIKLTNLKELIDGVNIDITFPYSEITNIDYLLKDITINNKIFDSNITYNIDIDLNLLETIKNKHIDYQINNYLKIEK